MRLDLAYRQEQSRAWMAQARRDCGAVERLLGPKPQHLPHTPEIAVYLLQQSVEKAVRALMVAVAFLIWWLSLQYGSGMCIF